MNRRAARYGPERFRKPAPPAELDPFDGVLLVDKPSGPTSHDIVDRIRRTFGFKKVGHGGTLDPMATGALVLLLGRGTKLSGHFIGSDKVYEGVMRLGIATDSHDLDGTVTAEADCSAVTQEQVEAEMRRLTGDQMQIPPMVSAVKVRGVPLYKRARKGQVVEREARLIHVYAFKLLEFDLPRVRFRLRCTKGTYVRKLCADIGDRLGCGAHLESLRRVETGSMNVRDATPLDDLLKLDREALLSRILPMSRFSAQQLPGSDSD